MKFTLNDKIINLSQKLNNRLYVVGGYVRNFLIDKSISKDIDLCGPIKTDVLLPLIEELGFTILGEYPRTSTLLFSDDKGQSYEYTAFRKDIYSEGGYHTPEKVVFTEDINEDALRRDFKCNAIYYNIGNGEFVDPLNGVQVVKNRVLNTVSSPEKVFCFDGLRLLRLCRFSGELNFSVPDDVLDGAKKFKDNLKDISAERIFDELNKILLSSEKYVFSDKFGHYNALKLAHEIGLLEIILPELTLGDKMEQRKDFHDHDVLEHTLRAVKYSHKSIRLVALLHDVGKPYAMIKDGKYYSHAIYGETIAKKILKRLKASSKTIGETTRLIKLHMIDVDLSMSENKLKKFIVKNAHIFDKLKLLRQADYSACKDDLAKCPSITKWEKIYDKMIALNTPFSIADLKISGADLIANGYVGKEIGSTLEKIFDLAILDPTINDREKLLKMIRKVEK